MTAVAEQLELLADVLVETAPAGPVASWWPDRDQVWARNEGLALERVAKYRATATTLDADDPATAARWRDLADLVKSGVTDARERRTS